MLSPLDLFFESGGLLFCLILCNIHTLFIPIPIVVFIIIACCQILLFFDCMIRNKFQFVQS